MIQTYLRIESRFIPIDQFSGVLPDRDYIEGAIVCDVDGKPIFSLHHYDLIDQLWAYIVDGLKSLKEGKCHDVYFPDQPLRLRFELQPHEHVRVTIGEKTTEVDSTKFLSTMQQGAEDFFSRIKTINPVAKETYERYESEARTL